MKKIILEYSVWERKTFNIPKNGFWAEWFNTWSKDEDDRTDEDWNLIDKASLEDFVKTQINGEISEVEVYDYE